MREPGIITASLRFNSPVNPDPQPPSRGTVVAVVAATTAAQTASVLGVAVFPVIAPELATVLGVKPALIGYQMTLTFGTAMLASPLLSFMVSRWGACRTTQIALGFCVVAMVAAASGTLWGLAVTSVFLGMAMSLMTPASAHLLFRYSPPAKRNFIFSLKQTGVPLAWVIMALAAPPIVLTFGWRSALLLVLVITLIVMLLLQPVRAAWDNDGVQRAAVPRSMFNGLIMLWRHPVLRWLGLSSLFLSMVQLCLSTFAVTMLVGEVGYTLVTAGWLLSLTQASGVGGRIFWGWLADRSGDSLRLLSRLAMVMVLCCVAVACVTPAWPTVILAAVFMLFGATAIGWNGLFLAEVARRSPPGEVSAMTGGAMTWNFCGILIGPATFATLYQPLGSYTATYGVLGVAATAALLSLLLCVRKAGAGDLGRVSAGNATA